jgi:phosphoserine phosphatase
VFRSTRLAPNSSSSDLEQKATFFMARFLVVLDVDSTLIENEVIELLAEQAGSLTEVSAITFRAMNGELDFEESLRSRVATLRGLPDSVFATVGAQVTVTEGVPQMISGIQSAGGRVGVVSGGFHEVVDPLATRLGLNYWRANRLEVVDGRLTGDLTGPIIDAAAKASTLREWADDFGVPLVQTVAVGDGANDLPMMAITGLAVGFDAKAPVRDEANVIMDRRDLSQLLPLLGLRG